MNIDHKYGLPLEATFVDIESSLLGASRIVGVQVDGHQQRNREQPLQANQKSDQTKTGFPTKSYVRMYQK